MIYHEQKEGICINCDSFSTALAEFGLSTPNVPLVILDPEYGRITKEKWDQVDRYNQWFHLAKTYCLDDATICMFGGIGKRGDRPFFKFLAEAECQDWQMKNFITWKKRRGYGKKNDYLFTREECAIFTRGKPTFNVPLLDKKRGYAGFSRKYPTKSEFWRRSNVWTDINDLFRGKIHPTEKPERLYEVLIETHTNPGDQVVDLCAGSMVTARAAIKTNRRFFCVEKGEEEYRKGVASIVGVK